MTTITEFDSARKNLLRSEGLRASRTHLENRQTGRTLQLLINVLHHQTPAKTVFHNIQHAKQVQKRFITFLTEHRIPFEKGVNHDTVLVRKFGGRGGTFMVQFTSMDILEANQNRRDPENIKIFFDEV